MKRFFLIISIILCFNLSYAQKPRTKVKSIKKTTEIESKTIPLNYSNVLKTHVGKMSYELWLNDLPIASNRFENCAKYNENLEILLHPFITKNQIQNLKVRMTPGYDYDGILQNTIQKGSGLFIKLVSQENNKLKEAEVVNEYGYITDTSIENGEKYYHSYPSTTKYGAKEVSFEYQFTPNIPDNFIQKFENYQDLRLEKDLKQQVLDFYKDLINYYKSQNQEKIVEFYLNMNQNIAEFNGDAEPMYSEFFMERLSNLTQNATIFKLNEDFELKVSSDGKFCIAMPKDSLPEYLDILRIIGYENLTACNFYFYKPKDSDKIKPYLPFQVEYNY